MKRALIGTLLVISLGYIAYVTLYQLGQAIQHGDASTLRRMVDWPAVREGIKEDIADLGTDPSDQLPPFGAGFMHGIAMHAVDARVTPDTLAGLCHGMRVTWAFFRSPTRFVVDVGTHNAIKPVQALLRLRHGAWRVTRIWLPPDLLGRTRVAVQ